jgi:hypothetical protein
MKKVRIKTVWHYEKGESKNSFSEFREVDIVVDDKKVASFGDEYHDKGFEKAEAFVEGYVLGRGLKENEYVKSESTRYDWTY